jgi:hypothetical protein
MVCSQKKAGRDKEKLQAQQAQHAQRCTRAAYWATFR